MNSNLSFKIKPLIASNIFSEEQVKNFVKKNNFAISNDALLGRRCIDGRETNLFAEALPGADAGYFLAIIAALRTIKADRFIDKNRRKIMEAVVADYIDNQEKFYFHTDTHAEHDHKGVARGCGHLRLTSENPEKYLVTQDDINAIFSYLEEKLFDSNFVQVVLEGDHQEKAVLIVDRDDVSIKALDKENQISVFVFTSQLVKKRIKRISQALVEKLAVSVQDLEKTIWDKLSQQLEATRQTLAGKLPVYQIS